MMAGGDPTPGGVEVRLIFMSESPPVLSLNHPINVNYLAWHVSLGAVNEAGLGLPWV
jgi:hypothetical protein